MSYIKKALRYIKRSVVKTAWRVLFVLPVKKDRIFVSNFYGNGYSDNPKYIVQELLNCGKKLDIIWCVKTTKNNYNLPIQIKQCKYNSFSFLYYMSTSSVWIDNCRKYYFYKKKKNQLYLQTWHGFALKKLEKDVLHTLSNGYESVAMKDAQNTDIMISDSSHMTSIYRSSFWYHGRIEQIGYPRYDAFKNRSLEMQRKIINFFNIDEQNSIVLYAPTFRQDESLASYDIDWDKLLDALQERFCNDFVLLIRLHPNISKKAIQLSYNSRVINASQYEDVEELLVLSDVLITDYSSVMFDYMITKRPCFLYASDLDMYTKERDFYINISDLPFPLSTTKGSLINSILSFDGCEYRAKVDSFLNKYNVICDNNSSQICSKIVLDHVCSL